MLYSKFFDFSTWNPSIQSAMVLLTSIATTFLLASPFLSIAKKWFRSKKREYTPQTHDIKNDTPTMGGILILLSAMLASLLWINILDPLVLLFWSCIAGFFAIGLLDDISKINLKKGITARSKFLSQIAIATITIGIWYTLYQENSFFLVPFLGKFSIPYPWLIIPWGVFVVVGTSNAVNLTDGLDGLVSGILSLNFATFGIISYFYCSNSFSFFTKSVRPEHGLGLALCSFAIVGCLLAFLCYNKYPAQIFMGDSGSLALGAGLGFVAMATRQELLLPISGGIFVAETMSVIIQVASFKTRRKRVFRMAPLHHHFELGGWSEKKVTTRFWIISVALSALAIFIFVFSSTAF